MRRGEYLNIILYTLECLHFYILLYMYIELYSSGVEEPYSEKDVLLQEIKELVEVQKNEKLIKQKKILAANKKMEEGKTVRNEDAISFFEKNACMVIDHDYGDIIEDGIAGKLTMSVCIIHYN